MPWRSVSSAILKASVIVVPLVTTDSSRSLGTTTRVSTLAFRRSMPASAFFMRWRPSNRKGLETTPMVSMPISRAVSAMIGAAPVPVPPPMPQVTNTRSEPLMVLAISSRLSSAAFWPTSGFAPAPRPLVSLSPIWICLGALERASACLSVFTAMKSTPRRPESTMRLTALVPAPPTPMTFIAAKLVSCSSLLTFLFSISNSSTRHPPRQYSIVVKCFVLFISRARRRGSSGGCPGPRPVRPDARWNRIPGPPGPGTPRIPGCSASRISRRRPSPGG